MGWNWFDLAWPWIGLLGAAVILGLAFGSKQLRGVPGVSPWRDPAWLGWLAVPAYLVHQAEEYGIDLLGRVHAFPAQLCMTLAQGPYPDCPIPPPFFPAVNISLIWVAAPLAALLGRRHKLVGLSFHGLLFTNALVHLVPFLRGGEYNAGTLTALVLFLPLSIWTAFACFGAGRLPIRGMVLLVAAGAIAHAVLMGSVFLFLRGAIGGTPLILIQVANAFLFVAIAWLGERLGLGRRMPVPAMPWR